jgi:hypothetical protein
MAPWFEVYLAGPEGLAEAAGKLDRAVRTAGHEACLARDEDGNEFVAVFVCGSRPAQELHDLMWQAHLFGSFELLQRPWWPFSPENDQAA